MKLYAKCLPEYFKMLGFKGSEFRQIESIVLENQETGDKREFEVTDIREVRDRSTVEDRYPLVEWDPEMPIFSIDLGDELDMNEMPVSVQHPAHQAGLISDRKVFVDPEAKEAWHGGVGD